MNLRTATPADGALLHTLVLELATWERAPERVEATPETFAAHLAADPPPFICVFAEIAGEAAGFTLFFPNYSTWRGKPGIWIEELYVRPAFRGQGVARALVGEVARRALEAGCGRIDLSVLDWNELAHGFYRRIGAHPLDTWTQWRIEEEGFKALAEESSP